MKMKKTFAALLAACLVCASFASCHDKNQPAHSAADDSFVQDFKAKFSKDDETEQLGTFVITLDEKNAPLTCKNFEKLVSDGFYDGLTFHRVVDDFVAQGGDPKGDGTGGNYDKDGNEINVKGEFSENGVDNKLSHTRGVVSMARAEDMDSASSQFFICYSDNRTLLDGKYAAFGKVDEEGMKVVDKFLDVERVTGSDRALSAPTTPIVIKQAKMIEDDKDGNKRAEFTMQLGFDKDE